MGYSSWTWNLLLHMYFVECHDSCPWLGLYNGYYNQQSTNWFGFKLKLMRDGAGLCRYMPMWDWYLKQLTNKRLTLHYQINYQQYDISLNKEPTMKSYNRVNIEKYSVKTSPISCLFYFFYFLQFVLILDIIHHVIFCFHSIQF